MQRLRDAARFVRAAYGAVFCAAAALAAPALVAAQTLPPAPAPSAMSPAANGGANAPLTAPSGPPASGAASPRPRGLHAVTNAALTYVGQGTGGPGTLPPEAAGFIAGSPLAPNTPYDLFSSTPLVNGNSGIGEIRSTITDGTPAFDLSLVAGLESVHGSVTNAAYWGESLMPTLNPHLGSPALPYAITFPTHPGQDDATATRLSILTGSAATADGNLRARAGWFDPAQTDRFVFAPPALTSLNPAIGYLPAETLANGLAGLDLWQPLASALPLHGADVTAKSGPASLELTNADLPALPGESARLTMGSLVFDRGEGTRLSAQILHASTGGIAFVTTVPFGAQPRFDHYPQGVLPTSLLSGQSQTIAGVRGAFHLLPAQNIDAVVEIGRAWYASALAARPGTSAPGGYYHGGLSRTHGRVTASVDVYRMEPRYATMILPYGIVENQWSVAFAWPGQWLKSNYALIDNSVLGVNRQGYRLRYYVDRGPFELHLEYVDLRQIDAETLSSAEQTGFVDGYYLPQHDDAATFGRQRRTGLWAAWHPAFGDLTLDIVDDTLYRPFVPAHPEDAVSYEVPQAMLTFARHLSPTIVASAGIGRYALKGTFSEPIDFAERLFFSGIEIRQTPRAALLVSFRRTASGGRTTFPLAPAAPDFTGTAIVVEQRLHF